MRQNSPVQILARETRLSKREQFKLGTDYTVLYDILIDHWSKTDSNSTLYFVRIRYSWKPPGKKKRETQYFAINSSRLLKITDCESLIDLSMQMFQLKGDEYKSKGLTDIRIEGLLTNGYVLPVKRKKRKTVKRRVIKKPKRRIKPKRKKRKTVKRRVIKKRITKPKPKPGPKPRRKK